MIFPILSFVTAYNIFNILGRVVTFRSQNITCLFLHVTFGSFDWSNFFRLLHYHLKCIFHSDYKSRYIPFQGNGKIQPLVLFIPCECAQSCPTLCDPMDCSLLGSSVHGIFQVRILEWVAISFSRQSSWPRDWTCISCITRWILYHWATWEALYLLHPS